LQFALPQEGHHAAIRLLLRDDRHIALVPLPESTAGAFTGGRI